MTEPSTRRPRGRPGRQNPKVIDVTPEQALPQILDQLTDGVADSQKRPFGRPTTLTYELLKQIAQLVREYYFERTVCDYMLIDRELWWHWKQRGARETSGIYRDFFNTVRKAKATAEMFLIKDIREGKGDVATKRWILERAARDHWGNAVTISLHAKAERLAAELGITADELIAEAERLAALASIEG